MTNKGEPSKPQSEPKPSDRPESPPIEIDPLLGDYIQEGNKPNPNRETRQK